MLDTEDRSNDAGILDLITEIKYTLKYITIENISLNCNNISQYYKHDQNVPKWFQLIQISLIIKYFLIQVRSSNCCGATEDVLREGLMSTTTSLHGNDVSSLQHYNQPSPAVHPTEIHISTLRG